MKKNFENISEKTVERMALNHLMSYDFKELANITDKWGYFRQLYFENIAEILSTSEKDIQKWTNAYYFDWLSHFSPIEQAAWNSIRTMGGIVLYPQFPLFNYFIDFANPYLKIGVELDGKAHNYLKDSERDRKLARYGWKIFRVRGFEVNRDYLTPLEMNEKGITGESKKREIENWILNTCDGVITALKYWYFLTPNQRVNFNYYLDVEEPNDNIDFYSLAKLTLENHNFINLKL